MFRNLIPRLAGSFRLIAPDYPGYGQSSMPDHKKFSYTFDNFAAIVDQLLEHLGINKYSIYIYGLWRAQLAIAWRCCIQSVSGLIVQNGNAYDGGAAEFWDPDQEILGRHPRESRSRSISWSMRRNTRWQYENGVEDITLFDPTHVDSRSVWLDRPGNREIQMDLMLDYGTNRSRSIPKFQAFFREYQPPTLIVWGKNDFVFPPEGAAPYARDLKNHRDSHAGYGPFCAGNARGRNRKSYRIFLPQAAIRSGVDIRVCFGLAWGWPEAKLRTYVTQLWIVSVHAGR